MERTITVAIVDDFPTWRQSLNAYLTELGYRIVCEATNGKELLDYLPMLEALPDVCLLDIQMPVMDGHDTARRLKGQYPSIGIFAF